MVRLMKKNILQIEINPNPDPAHQHFSDFNFTNFLREDFRHFERKVFFTSFKKLGKLKNTLNFTQWEIFAAPAV